MHTYTIEHEQFYPHAVAVHPRRAQTIRGIRLWGSTWLTFAWEERTPGTSTWVQRFGLWIEHSTGEGTILFAWGDKQV
jgi:hypothetical protein